MDRMMRGAASWTGSRKGFSVVEVAMGAAVLAVMATGVISLLAAERAVGEAVRITHLLEIDELAQAEAEYWSPPLAAEARAFLGEAVLEPSVTVTGRVEMEVGH